MFVKTGPGSKNLVMDNVRFHYTENVKRFVENRGHSIIYLPPYSPQLNPIKLLFSKWKSLVKSDMTIFDSRDLTHAINQASLQITTDNCLGWIRESTIFVSLAFRREPM
ncbi:hypothetical protein RF11_05841 [Thelohanellus kitauei]|uniref:Tc1-like transposase DDE domain-containing protein n=1 Tax=Thelohanellus kitauei TaxID=669202 RepID=A0A0C2MHJ3_THEKT|nr:hypothetical protein RF11_05841 [Thelohanellus kitauei]